MMNSSSDSGAQRLTGAVHGTRTLVPDKDFELGLADQLRREFPSDALGALYSRFVHGESSFDAMMRRAVWRASIRKMGHGVQIAPGATFRNPETIELGNGVHIGTQAYLQGCPGGRCIIGNFVWIGPQSYLDARDVEIEDHVGWGPGAKLLTSEHTAIPEEVPIIQTDLRIRPVRIQSGADVGTGAIVLPGVTIGHGSIVGAGAVVNKDVPPLAVVAGVPARLLRWRDTKSELEHRSIRSRPEPTFSILTGPLE